MNKKTIITFLLTLVAFTGYALSQDTLSVTDSPDPRCVMYHDIKKIVNGK